jgi:hypothetical protein
MPVWNLSSSDLRASAESSHPTPSAGFERRGFIDCRGDWQSLDGVGAERDSEGETDAGPQGAR